MDYNIVQEGQFLAIFNSTHRVLKAEGVLKGEKLEILLIPAPKGVKTDCGLAIRFNSQDQDRVMGLLKQNSLLPAFLCRYENGAYIVLKEFDREED